jgi:hypothetical protein
MTDMDFMKILWAASTLSCTISVIGLISIYRKMSIGLSIISVALHHIVINKGVVEYGSRVQGVAEDTEVAE